MAPGKKAQSVALTAASAFMLLCFVFATLIAAACGTTECTMDGDCDDNNQCTLDICDAGWCRNPPVRENSCNDDDACTTDVCLPDVGCRHYAKTCEGDNMCLTYSCDKKWGCRTAPKNCSLGKSDKCMLYGCDPTTGCTETPTPCSVPEELVEDACYFSYCDADTGECVVDYRNYDDGNKCLIRTCDKKTGEMVILEEDCDDGNICTTDTCDEGLGCLHTLVDCFDGNKCNKYACVPDIGCVYRAITCPTPTNSCLVSQCDDGKCIEREATFPRIDDDCAIPVCDASIGWTTVSPCFANQTCVLTNGGHECVPDECGKNIGTCGDTGIYNCYSGMCTLDADVSCATDNDCYGDGSVCCFGTCIERSNDNETMCCGDSDLAFDEARCTVGMLCSSFMCAQCYSHQHCASASSASGSTLTRCDTETGMCVQPECTEDSECEDEDECTVDSCDISEGECKHTLVPWTCACHTSDDCEEYNASSSSLECAFCDAGLCRTMLTCDDGDPDTTDEYVRDVGCIHTTTKNSVRSMRSAEGNNVCAACAGYFLIAPGATECGEWRDRFDPYALAIKMVRPRELSMTTRDDAVSIDSEGLALWQEGWKTRLAKKMGLATEAEMDGIDPVSTPLSCYDFRAFMAESGASQTQRHRSAGERPSGLLVRKDEIWNPVIYGVCSDNDPCTTDICARDEGGQAVCLHAPKNCFSGDMCVVGECNGTSGQCEYTNTQCTKEEEEEGDPDSQSEATCATSWCFPGDGRCYSTNECEPTAIACDPEDCNNGDEYAHHFCNNVTGLCYHVPIGCDDGDACTLDVVIPFVGCVHIGAYHETQNDSDIACTRIACNHDTGELTMEAKTCDDSNLCTDDVCIDGVGCTFVVAHSYVDVRACATQKTCSPRTEECMDFVCLNPITGEYVWTPKISGIECNAHDPCSRYACDGTGVCALRPGISASCRMRAFSNLPFAFLFVFTIFVGLAGLGLAIYVYVLNKNRKATDIRLRDASSE